MQLRARAYLAWTLLWGLGGFDWPGEAATRAGQMADASPQERQRILRELSVARRDEVAEAVLAALSDADAGVRATAAGAAARLDLREASVPLVSALSESAAEVRAAVARALGKLGDGTTVPALTRTLKDPDVSVRLAATDALAQLGDPRAVPALIAQLEDPESSARAHAARALLALGDATATVPLVGKARDPVPEVRLEIVRALVRIGDTRAMNAFLQALDDDSSEVALSAVQGIGVAGGEQAWTALKPLLSGSDERMARAALSALPWLEANEALAAIVSAAQQPRLHDLAPVALAAALERHPDRVVVAGTLLADALDTALDEAHALVLVDMVARTALARRAPVVAAALLHAYDDGHVPWSALLGPLSRVDDPAVRLRLLESTETSAPDSDAALLAALERTLRPGMGSAADPLIAWIPRIEPVLVPRLIALLARLGSPRVAPALAAHLHDTEPKVRVAALDAVGNLAHRAALEDAFTLLRDSHEDVRIAAGRAVGKLADAGASADLIQLAAGTDDGPRRAALVALAAFMAQRKTPKRNLRARLLELLGEVILQAADEETAAYAIDLARAWGERGVLPVLLAIDARYAPTRRIAAARALGDFDTDEARQRLRTLAEDRDERIAASALIAWAPRARADDLPWLAERVEIGPWPVGPAAAYVVAELARSGALGNAQGTVLCAIANAAEPHSAANGLAALGTRGYEPCAAAPVLSALLAGPDARHRAARAWAEVQLATRDTDPSVRRRLHSALDQARDRIGPSSPGVVAPAQGWTAVQSQDGRVVLSYPDALGRLATPSGVVIAAEAPWHAKFTPPSNASKPRKIE